MKKRVESVVFATVLGTSSVLAQVQVDINLDVKHEVGGIAEFDREKYMVLHAGLRDNDWDSASQRDSFLNDYDVYLGRNNGSMPWQLSQVEEHPTNTGWVDLTDLENNGDNTRSTYGSDTAVHSLEARSKKMMIGGQMSMYPNGQTNGNGFAIGNYEALAEYYANYFSYFHGTGGTDGEPKPKFVEVVNEPFVAAGRYGTTKENIAEMHNVVAQAMKQAHPEIMVGGYTAAHPAYESGNFGHWDTNWRMFIDTAGTNMDFFSLHLYDYLNLDISTDPADTQYRSGSNVEAILDMVEHYSMLSLGEVKPFAISEFGAFEPKDGGIPWSAEQDWTDIRSYSTIMMQLMERPDRILHAIPFMILKAEWGRDGTTGNPYGPRLLRQNFEKEGETGNHWVYTERIKWFELWKEVSGTRVDTDSSDPDIQVDTYVEGTNAFVIVSSLVNTGAVDVALDLIGSSQVLDRVEVKHAYADENRYPVLAQYTTNELASITLPASSTAVIKYVFETDVTQTQTAMEAKYYASTYLQEITAGMPIHFNITNVAVSATYGEAVLRLGLGRAHGLSLQPQLTINGTDVPVPADWRGYDQATRDKFFGVIEIPVPYDLLENNNAVTVQFDDNGGHVSSMAMQVFDFESDIRARAKMIPINSADIEGVEVILGFTNGPANSWFELHSKSNLLEGGWVIEQKGLPINATGEGFVTNGLDGMQGFYRLLEGSAPGIPVSGFMMEPEADSVGVGGTCRLYYVVTPDDAEDKGVVWTSSNPSVATVSGGIVTGISNGIATIMGETSDGGYSDTCVITVGTTTAQMSFDDVYKYQNQSFTNGNYLNLKTSFDAGSGHTVESSGIRYLLRQIDSTGGPWSVVKDYEITDFGAVGNQSGASEGSIWLPDDIIPTDNLPANNFYFLFVTFDSTDGSSYNASTQPIIIVNPDAPTVIYFNAPDYSDGALDGQQDWSAEAGWSVSNSATSGIASIPDNASAAVLTNAIQLVEGESYALSINFQFGGTYSTPTNWAYTFLGGLKDNASGASVGTGSGAADANIQIFKAEDKYRLLNNYSGISGASTVTGTLDGGDTLQFDYELTLGADAASTTYTVRLQNVTDGDDTGTGTVTGVDQSIYDALTGSGAYGFFQSISPGAHQSGLSGVHVNSVSTRID